MRENANAVALGSGPVPLASAAGIENDRVPAARTAACAARPDMDRRPFRTPYRLPSGLAAALACALLAACAGPVLEREVNKDFAALQATGAIPARARLERIELTDGWSDGAEVEVYFCLPDAEGPGRGCEPRNVGLSYQKLDGRWRLFSVQAEQAVE